MKELEYQREQAPPTRTSGEQPNTREQQSTAHPTRDQSILF